MNNHKNVFTCLDTDASVDMELITEDIPASGTKSIDTQHQLLKGMLNDIISHYNENDHSFEKEYSTACISGFVAYCFSHFVTEESIQKKEGWPGHEKHRTAHIECRETMLEYQEAINDKFTDAVMYAAVIFIRDWFVEHTCNRDTSFYAFRDSKEI